MTVGDRMGVTKHTEERLREKQEKVSESTRALLLELPTSVWEHHAAALSDYDFVVGLLVAELLAHREALREARDDLGGVDLTDRFAMSKVIQRIWRALSAAAGPDGETETEKETM